MTGDRLTYVPQSHKGIQLDEFAAQIRFATDELALLADVLLERGIDPLVVTDAFVEVAGTIRDRVEINTRVGSMR